MAAGDAALVGEREDALGARIDRLVHGMAEARHLLAARRDRHGDRRDDFVGIAAGVDLLARLDENLAAELGGAEDDGAAAENAGGDGALQRVRARRRRSCAPRCAVGVRPCSAMATSRRSRKIALRLAGLASGHQEVEDIR